MNFFPKMDSTMKAVNLTPMETLLTGGKKRRKMLFSRKLNASSINMETTLIKMLIYS